MLTINLLPTEEQKNIRLERWRRIIIFFAGLVSLVLVTGSVLLFPSFLPPLFEKRELEKFLIMEEENYKRMNIGKELEEAKEVKKTIAAVRGFASTDPKASGAVEDIISMAGGGVFITQLNMSKSGAFAISGTSVNRRDLLLFEEKLKGSPKIQEVNSPLSNIVRGGSSFTIQGKFKPGKGL